MFLFSHTTSQALHLTEEQINKFRYLINKQRVKTNKKSDGQFQRQKFSNGERNARMHHKTNIRTKKTPKHQQIQTNKIRKDIYNHLFIFP